MAQNIDEFEKFLSIRQHFTHQNFLLPDNLLLFACLPDYFFMQGVITSIRANVILFPVHN